MGRILIASACMLAAVIIVGVQKFFKGLPPKGEGFAAPGWNRVAKVFKRHLEDGYHRGGGFAVYHKGQLVMEFVGGYADYEAEWPWDKTTLSCLYSTTQGIGAIVIAILVDRGLLDYSSPVAKYWPEFAENGKESITVEQLLSHQTGLVALEESVSLFDLMRKPEKISHLLATARPQWEPGTAHGVQCFTVGLYMDQLVRRVDPHHRSLDQFFAEEVSRKFGIDCFVGLPKEENYRCARNHVPLTFLFEMLLNPKYWKLLYAANFDSGSNIMKMVNSFAESRKNLYNNPVFREIPSASSHGYATVAGIAQLYGILANGGCHENQTLLSPSAVEKLNEPLVSGVDSVYLFPTTFGRGTVIMTSDDGYNIFGNPGFGGQVGFADPKHKLGWAYITNHQSIFIDADDWRYLQLVEMVYETVRELERREKTSLQ